MVRLGDVIEAKYGKALPRPNRHGGDVPVYGSNGIVGWHDTPIATAPTIVIGRKGSFGEVNFSNVPCWPIDTTYFIDNPGPYKMEFLEQLLRSLGLTGLDQSTAIPGLSRDRLYDIEVPVPTAGEQGKISQLISAVEERRTTSLGHLRVARRAIERFRQAVLAAACSGRLTADWRDSRAGLGSSRDYLKDIQATRNQALGGRARQAIRPADHPFEVPEGWALSSLDAISLRVTSGSRDWSKFYGRGSGTFVMAQNVRKGYIDWSYRQAVDPPAEDASRERSQIQLGDLLVTIVGANTGDVGPVLDARPQHYVCQSVALIRPVDARVTPFLNLWFNSPNHGRGYFETCIYGAGRPHLSFDQLKSAPIALPTPGEQEEITRRVDDLLGLADVIRQRIETAARQVDRSSQAILAKAFRGDLEGAAR